MGRYCNCKEPITRNLTSRRCLKCGKMIHPIDVDHNVKVGDYWREYK